MKPSGSTSRIQLTPSGSSSRLMMRRRSTAGADDPEFTNSMGHSLNSKTRGGMATMGKPVPSLRRSGGLMPVNSIEN